MVSLAKLIKWFLKNFFNDFKFPSSQIKDILLGILKYTLRISSTTNQLKNKKLDKEYFVLKFENKLLDRMNINDVIEKCNKLFPSTKCAISKLHFHIVKHLKILYTVEHR